MTEITTHVLDTATGRPAGGVPVSLQREVSDGEWTEIGQGLMTAAHPHPPAPTRPG
jgi:5-hydroxyisourate hydrolase-like protein (transthyretin family)